MPTTIIINAAGCGSRLGKGIPKSLVSVGSRKILDWQLNEMCRPSDHVKIVVGYMGDEVGKLAKNLFPSIEVLHNSDWATTKTAASLSLGKRGTTARCLSLDGDLLVHPDDFRQLVECDMDVIGITPVISAQPVFVEICEKGNCRSFSFEKQTPWEWTGLVNFDPTKVSEATGNVFEMMECLLPTPTLCVRTVEVDTVEDLRHASLVWSSMMKDLLRKGAGNGLTKNPGLLAG